MKPRAATAYHEAGHAVAARLLSVRFKEVTILPTKTSLGHVLPAAPPKWFEPDVARANSRIRSQIENRTRVLLAGPAAEARFKGRHDWRSASDDIRQAVSLLDYVSRSNGEVEAYFALMRIQAGGLIEKHWDEVQGVAEALLERTRLTAKDVAKIITALDEAKVTAWLDRVQGATTSEQGG